MVLSSYPCACIHKFGEYINTTLTAATMAQKVKQHISISLTLSHALSNEKKKRKKCQKESTKVTTTITKPYMPHSLLIIMPNTIHMYVCVCVCVHVYILNVLVLFVIQHVFVHKMHIIQIF